MRYFITGDSEGNWSSTTALVEGNKLLIRTGSDAKPARTFKAVVYAPGCQFVTISTNDLSTGSRQAEFQCQKLPTVQFQGRFDGGSQKNLQIETVYEVSWVQQFFEIPSISVSPFTLSEVPVGPDGSFKVEVPDFTADPLWSYLSHDASLAFYLVDGRSGRRITTLSTSHDSPEGAFKVAPSYPAEIEFTVQRQASGKSQ